MCLITQLMFLHYPTKSLFHTFQFEVNSVTIETHTLSGMDRILPIATIPSSCL